MTSASPRRRCALALSFLLAMLITATTAAAQQQPRFQTSVDVTSVVDVAVVDSTGHPITGLGVGDFNVWVDGDRRRVLSAEWVSVVDDARERALNVLVPEGYSSNENMGGGRLVIIAVDQASIPFGGSAAMMSSLTSFIDKLLPTDRVGIVGFGTGATDVGATELVFLSDLARAKQLVTRMAGLKQPGAPTSYNVGIGESLSILRGELGMLDGAVARECVNMAPRSNQYSVCSSAVRDDAGQIAREALDQANSSITGLSNLMTKLKSIEEPKIVVLISQGFVVDDGDNFAEQIGRMAAAARATLYVLHLNENAFDNNSGRRPASAIEDRRIGVVGLEALAKVARGGLFTINGAGAGVFERIQSEISGYYLVGIEPDARDRDGKAHPLKIEVPWNGAVVRSRRMMLNPTTAVDRRTPQERIGAGLTSPLPMASLPVRVATFALQGSDAGRVQVLIHADIGRDFKAPRRLALGYSIVDQHGQEVDTRRIESRLLPVMNGEPSALQFAAGASLVPGEYTLRLAAADGERAGSVEHRFRADLSTAGGVKLSELVVGGPTAIREFLSPTVGYTVSFGSVHGYLEAYGDQADAVTVKYEIVAAQGSAALLTADVPGRLFGDDRIIFTHVMAVRELPPGPYVLRALVSLAGRPLTTLSRGFEVAASARAETAADDPAAAPAEAAADVFLPVDEQIFARPFSPGEATAPAVLKPFRDRLDGAATQAFETAIAALTAKALPKAESSLKSAVQPDIDSTALLAYLGVVYAEAGMDFQAIGAWHSALVGGENLPQLYAWLSQALLRTHRLAEAQDLLEEANEKFPSDPRFTGPLAAVYATFGRGREAILMLEQFLNETVNEVEAARMGVEWIYQIHSIDRVVHSRGEDVDLARAWVARYGAGPRQALVRQWLDVLERDSR
jgi:VWFA-related protein